MLRFDNPSPGIDQSARNRFRQECQYQTAQGASGRIPGYSGHVRGSKCVDGTSFGKMSRMDGEQMLRSFSNALPAEPNRLNSPVRRTRGGSRVMNKSRSIAGYAGFSPGARDRVGPTVNRGFSEQSSPATGFGAGLTQSRTNLTFGSAAKTMISNGLMGTQLRSGPIRFDGGKKFFDPAPELSGQLNQAKIPGYSGYVPGKGSDSTYGVGQSYGLITTSSKAASSPQLTTPDWQYKSMTQSMGEQISKRWPK